uniref:Uncharacterized protein n=1 Tax=virus sp. ct9pU4 TaxID=2828248 RepID=A0A8S5RBL0_9VIRU|nr:MAG TPA: hypothetical protein [virus sp. ct9pU4]DAW07254.1 MAG TPA: hypothetical protein [Caudoviricetes sp.]
MRSILQLIICYFCTIIELPNFIYQVISLIRD